VPSVEPGLVRFSSEPMVGAFMATLSGFRVTFASPKSRIFACPRFVTKMFAGLMSRWTIPFVCAASSVGDLDAQIEHRLGLHRLTADSVPERLPLQQFHGDEGSPIDLIDFVDRADVRVVQRGRSLGFSLETAEGLRIIGEFVGKELQSDVATELKVFSLIHHAHAPAADLAQDTVMGNRLPHGFGRSGHW